MQIDPLKIHKESKLIHDYRKENKAIHSYFDYHPFGDFSKRVNDLRERAFPRRELSNVLDELNISWDAPESTLENIKRLQDENSVVVIGGQQAGLLTGPLYTVNKVISILQLSKQKEMELGIPVIPVFWIAGEDHDFDEINHIYLPEKTKMKKLKFNQKEGNTNSVSMLPMDRLKVQQWIDEIFQALQETAYSKELYKIILHSLDSSNSYTDFFARLIFRLFPKEGIVLIDSADPLVRKIERPYFLQLIEKQNQIAESVHESLEKLIEEGYSTTLEVDKNSANLFYHLDKERILLRRNNSGDWIGKQNEIKLTTNELIRTVKETPSKLSNNVVTRPIMQELLFPTLAFVGGPGEISYWATLKNAFHALEIKMPPIIPRLSFTLIDRKVEGVLEEYNISLELAVNEGLDQFIQDWISKQSNPPIDYLTKDLKQVIKEKHEPIQKMAKEIRADIGDLAEKNLRYLYKEIEFIERRILKAVEEKYSKEIADIRWVNNILHPGGLQERIWNPLPWLNAYGIDFIREMVQANCSYKNPHYIVRI